MDKDNISFATTEKKIEQDIKKNTYYSSNDYTMNYPEGYPKIPKEEPRKIDHVNPNL